MQQCSILLFSWEIHPMPAFTAVGSQYPVVGMGTAQTGCPRFSMLLGHALPSLPDIPISQHIQAAPAITSVPAISYCPWRPKVSCMLPQLCHDDFQLLPREGILLTLALEETTALFCPLWPPGLQVCWCP